MKAFGLNGITKTSHLVMPLTLVIRCVTKMNPIEEFIKGVYAEQIKRKPTFDEKMQEHIKRELERLVEEANRLREEKTGNGENN